MKKIIIVFLISILGFGIIACEDKSDEVINKNTIKHAQRIFDLEFTKAERDSLLTDLRDNLDNFTQMREINVPNSIPPVLHFNPLPLGYKPPVGKSKFIMGPARKVDLPKNLNDLAFYSVRELGILIRNKKITSLELTKFFLDRLKKYNQKLNCVITLTEDLAISEAKKADAEIKAGKYRGPLHGIPYGAKDLLAKKGYKTTWGAMPYKEQIIDEDATVIKKLKEAGAVLVAKTSLGALAWGDVWYDAKTKNPWNIEEGSSGSSAGSASATAAGLVPFAIGSETWGSIVSPSARCGTTGLRPTFGRVSRTGAMALSWSMDKLGPICRTVEDCAIVFNAIYGPDGMDQTVVNFPFKFDADYNLKNLKIGYLKSAFEEEYDNQKYDTATLEKLSELGFDLIPIELPELPVYSLSFILSAEAAAAFDDLTRSNKDDMLVRQIRNAWPNSFRASRFIPAVEYIQANRIRYMLIQEMQNVMDKVDIYIAPSFGGGNLLMTNLTGHPCVVLPNGFDEDNCPVSITFTGDLFEEGKLLAFSEAYQRGTDFHKKHPSLFTD